MSHTQKRGSVYYFRRVIPKDVRAALGGGAMWVYSLHTKDHLEAKRLARIEAVAKDRLIAEARAGAAVAVEQYPMPGGTPAPIKMASEAGRRWEREAVERDLEGADAEFHAAEAADADPARRLMRDALEGARENWEEEQRQERAEQRQRRAAGKVPLMELFDGYLAERKPGSSAQRDWRAYLRNFIAHVGHDDASRITAGNIIDWKNKLLTEPNAKGEVRSARTVRDGYLVAVKITLTWAVENQRLATNVAASVKVRVPKQVRLRDRGFTNAEAHTILGAALVPVAERMARENVYARRWIPWLCAYTGARVNELSQLRGQDVEQVEGVWTILITPEAGTVKTGVARRVPLHPHLLEQGFPSFVAERGKGPLFYDPTRQRVSNDQSRHVKKVGERLAAWVRSIGITDTSLQPNHGWRHRFKTVAREVDMNPEARDAIQGHAPATEGQRYGSYPLAALAAELAKLPTIHLAPKAD